MAVMDDGGAMLVAGRIELAADAEGGTEDTAARLRRFLARLSELMAAEGLTGELFLASDRSPSVSERSPARANLGADESSADRSVRALAGELVVHEGPVPGWIRRIVASDFPADGRRGVTAHESPALRVRLASARYGLAMAMHAARSERDFDDAIELFAALGLRDAQDALDVLREYFPARHVGPRDEYVAAVVAAAANATRS